MRMKKRNPVIDKARKEGYELGFKVGSEHAKQYAVEAFAEKFEGLDKVPGIGPKVIEKVINHFGREYFKKK